MEIRPSINVDIVIISSKIANGIIRDFGRCWWKMFQRLKGNNGFEILTLKKNKTIFDIIFIGSSRKDYTKEKEVVKYLGFNLGVISKERLFL